VRPALAASVLKKAKAVADFDNFASFIFILSVPLPTHCREKHYCRESSIAAASAKKSSPGKASSQFATRV